MPRMEPDQARRRFTAARVARLATVDEAGRPHLVPVVFAAAGEDALVTAVDRKPKRTTDLKRLRHIAAAPSVCLLVDAYDEDWERLWWVRADATAAIVRPDAPDAAVRERYAAAVARLCRKYPQYRADPPDGPVVAMDVHRWSGWQAAPPPDARPAG
ncbi:TIGR03668 family PPOX class F420-dependent oxidoreductase [Streptomyces sp. NPDC015220]|uniref:TIGR03668 family PPOX class F420-dependent oxidoreductase n=1 Tax=Streptomyces sp. NPDC015220 TaxID=3364947 RepID=UPI0036FB10E9